MDPNRFDEIMKTMKPPPPRRQTFREDLQSYFTDGEVKAKAEFTEEQQAALDKRAEVLRESKNAHPSTGLFLKEEFTAFSEDFVAKVFDLTRELMAAQPDKIYVDKKFVKRGAEAHEAVDFWADYLGESEGIDVEEDGDGKTECGFPTLMRMRPDVRVKVYLAIIDRVKFADEDSEQELSRPRRAFKEDGASGPSGVKAEPGVKAEVDEDQ